MKLGSMVAVFGAMLPGLVACGSACENWCEDTLDCVSSDVNEDALDEAKSHCDEACDEMEEQAEDAGCENAFDKYMTCVEEEGDVCEGSPECSTEQSAYGTCMSKYCNDHPSAEGCGGSL
jgi:hypothetical protein